MKRAYQLISMRIGPVTVCGLGTRKVQGTRSYQQGAQYGAIIGIGHQRVAIVETRRIAHQILNDFG